MHAHDTPGYARRKCLQPVPVRRMVAACVREHNVLGHACSRPCVLGEACAGHRIGVAVDPGRDTAAHQLCARDFRVLPQELPERRLRPALRVQYLRPLGARGRGGIFFGADRVTREVLDRFAEKLAEGRFSTDALLNISPPLPIFRSRPSNRRRTPPRCCRSESRRRLSIGSLPPAFA